MSSPVTDAPVVWARVDDDFYVATRRGEFHGFVDRRSADTFSVFDQYSRFVGGYPRLDEAKNALAVDRPPRQRGRVRRRLPFFATASVTAVLGATLMTAGVLSPLV